MIAAPCFTFQNVGLSFGLMSKTGKIWVISKYFVLTVIQDMVPSIGMLYISVGDLVFLNVSIGQL